MLTISDLVLVDDFLRKHLSHFETYSSTSLDMPGQKHLKLGLLAKLLSVTPICAIPYFFWSPAVYCKLLFYRQLEDKKTIALRERKGNYEAPVEMSMTTRHDLTW